jgi:hypothetical protein
MFRAGEGGPSAGPGHPGGGSRREKTASRARARAAAKIRLVPAGRPSLLTSALVDQLAERVERGEPLGTAANKVGASPRSLRRWRQAGRAQLQALALEGRLEQRLALAFERAQAEPEDWETIAARLEANEAAWAALDLGPVGLDL